MMEHKRRRIGTSSPYFRREDVSDYEDSGDESYTPKYKEMSHQKKTRKQNKRRHILEPEPCAALIPQSEAKSNLERNVGLHSKSTHVIRSPGVARAPLLRWYAGINGTRGMPWRKPYDPSQGPEERAQRAYEVWVSEIMLQQTQVVTVIPYYTRWIEKFPTIRDLAASNIDEVNALWKGLGYYSRASRLFAGAQKAVAQYGARLPDNAKDMEANIPGIGRYSAGAISSIAYGERVPVLDGNVHRLLSRYLALHAPPKAKATLDILWNAATTMVELETTSMAPSTDQPSEITPIERAQYPGDINQALIELGSTICKVRDPSCHLCPLRPWCRAYIESSAHRSKTDVILDIEDTCSLCEPLEGVPDVTAYPMKVNRKKPREEIDVVNVVEWSSSRRPGDRWFLMVRRPDGGLLAGLYEFPTSSNVSKATSRTVQAKIPHELLSGLLVPSILPYDKGKLRSSSAQCLQIKSITTVGDVVHVFSHIRKTYKPQWVVLVGGETPPFLACGADEASEIPKLSVVDDDDDGSSTSLQPREAIWVRLEEVVNINMGTGVVKVWNLTKELWERDIGGT